MKTQKKQLVWYGSVGFPNLLTARLYRDNQGYFTAWGLIVNDKKGKKEYYSKSSSHHASNSMALHSLFIEVSDLIQSESLRGAITYTNQLRYLRIMLEQLGDYSFDCFSQKQPISYHLLRFEI